MHNAPDIVCSSGLVHAPSHGYRLFIETRSRMLVFTRADDSTPTTNIFQRGNILLLYNFCTLPLDFVGDSICTRQTQFLPLGGVPPRYWPRSFPATCIGNSSDRLRTFHNAWANVVHVIPGRRVGPLSPFWIGSMRFAKTLAPFEKVTWWGRLFRQDHVAKNSPSIDVTSRCLNRARGHSN